MNSTTTNSAPLRTGGIAASRDYAELPAWQKAITLAERAYKISEAFAESNLANELRAAAARIATHIAAGSAKPNEQGILNSYFDAQAASAELATLVTIAERLGYVTADDAASFSEDRNAIARLLIGMRHGLKVEAKDEKRKEREVGTRDREHFERNDRPDRKPRGEYKPRERSDRDTGREERQYKPRGEFKPKRDYSDKPRGDYKPRSDKPRSDKPYGDRKPRAEGTEYKPKRDYSDKPRGDYKPRSDKPRSDKPYGDRPPRKNFRKD